MEWTPERVFLFTYMISSLNGLGVYLGTSEPLQIRPILYSMITGGGLGIGFGMVAWQWLGGAENPWIIIGCGSLTGLGILRPSDVVAFARKVIGAAKTEGN